MKVVDVKEEEQKKLKEQNILIIVENKKFNQTNGFCNYCDHLNKKYHCATPLLLTTSTCFTVATLIFFYFFYR